MSSPHNRRGRNPSVATIFCLLVVLFLLVGCPRGKTAELSTNDVGTVTVVTE